MLRPLVSKVNAICLLLKCWNILEYQRDTLAKQKAPSPFTVDCWMRSFISQGVQLVIGNFLHVQSSHCLQAIQSDVSVQNLIDRS
jgi:hypothetical protein